jgi:uncharacterized protein
MPWRTAKKSNLNDLVSFLAPRESTCVSFTSRLLEHARGEGPVLPGRFSGTIHLFRTEGSPIAAAAFRTSFGLILPVFDDNLPVDSGEVGALVTRFSPVTSLMGLAYSVDALACHIEASPRERREYYLMVRPASPFSLPPPPFPGISARPAFSEDASVLFPLQCAYEKEEVLLVGDRLNAAASRILLEKSLKKETVWLAEYRGAVIAKAGTNARGFLWDQLGGIFVGNEFRSRGVGRWIVANLISALSREGKGTCLFVKKTNTGAITMYRRLGFEIRENFSISYYR